MPPASFIDARLLFIGARALFIGARALFTDARLLFIGARLLFIDARALFIDARASCTPTDKRENGAGGECGRFVGQSRNFRGSAEAGRAVDGFHRSNHAHHRPIRHGHRASPEPRIPRAPLLTLRGEPSSASAPRW